MSKAPSQNYEAYVTTEHLSQVIMECVRREVLKQLIPDLVLCDTAIASWPVLFFKCLIVKQNFIITVRQQKSVVGKSI